MGRRACRVSTAAPLLPFPPSSLPARGVREGWGDEPQGPGPRPDIATHPVRQRGVEKGGTRCGIFTTSAYKWEEEAFLFPFGYNGKMSHFYYLWV